MGQIRVLEQAVAERIAAGEVVERPASVVKELIENSLDAGATQVVVEVAGAGIDLIRVGDNGSGMDADDLRLSVRRFATSKIAAADDLQQVRTFGFRGEALPSIAAVSHLEITSAPAGAVEALRLRLTGGTAAREETAGAPAGTTVTVRRLFYNTPARRKFLKSPSREFALVVDTVNRLALAHPAVAFRLIHQGGEVVRYPAGRDDDRMAAVLGPDTYERTEALHEVVGDLVISGRLGRPELARATRRHQYCFVNRRTVQSRMLTGAIEHAYHQLLPVGRFPIFAVFIDLSPDRVDVNVHPRKVEVRFDDDHQVFGAVSRAVRAALRAVPLIRTADTPQIAVTPEAGLVPLPLSDATTFTGVAEPTVVSSTGRLPAMRLLGQLHGTYLLAQSDGGMVVIDQHAAHERVLYERLLRKRTRGAGDSQVLIAPVTVTLEPGDAGLVEAHGQALADLGFHLEPFGDRTVLIRAVPGGLDVSSPERLLRDLLAELAGGDRLRSAQSHLERLTIATACHTAVRAGDRLNGEQMAMLLRDLAETDDPFTCFHGRPTMITIPLTDVDRWFLRK